MRLDKYLKVTHLIRRREAAKEFIDAGYAFVNQKVAKPSTEIKVGDNIVLNPPKGRKITVEVIEIKNSCPLDKVNTMYKVVDDGEN